MYCFFWRPFVAVYGFRGQTAWSLPAPPFGGFGKGWRSDPLRTGIALEAGSNLNPLTSMCTRHETGLSLLLRAPHKSAHAGYSLLSLADWLTIIHRSRCRHQIGWIFNSEVGTKLHTHIIHRFHRSRKIIDACFNGIEDQVFVARPQGD